MFDANLHCGDTVSHKGCTQREMSCQLQEPQDAAAMLNRVCCMLKALAGPPRLCLIIDNAEDVFDAVGQAQVSA